MTTLTTYETEMQTAEFVFHLEAAKPEMLAALKAKQPVAADLLAQSTSYADETDALNDWAAGEIYAIDMPEGTHTAAWLKAYRELQGTDITRDIDDIMSRTLSEYAEAFANAETAQ